MRLAHQVVELAALGARVRRGRVGEPRAPGKHAHAKRTGDPRDVLPDPAQPDDAQRLAVHHRRRGHRPLASSDGGVGGWNLAHDRGRQRNRQLGGAYRVASRRLGNDDAAIARGSEVDVIRVVARLDEHAHVRKLIEQFAREPRPLAIGNERVEPAQHRRITKRCSEDPHVGPFPKLPDALRAIPDLMDVVENRDVHV